jgi:hypothetical protein
MAWRNLRFEANEHGRHATEAGFDRLTFGARERVVIGSEPAADRALFVRRAGARLTDDFPELESDSTVTGNITQDVRLRRPSALDRSAAQADALGEIGKDRSFGFFLLGPRALRRRRCQL